MSINGISNPLLGSLGPMGRPDVARPQTDRAGSMGTPAGAPAGASVARPTLPTQTPIAGQGGAHSAVPMEAPAGTDPVLWGVLTTEERTFFAKTAALGPLTYGRVKAVTHPAPPTARGVRLDVRA
jgi:hypothetical protein